MKKIVIIIFSILLIIAMFNVYSSTKSSLSKEQKYALKNCLEFIKNGPFEGKDKIDTNIVSVKVLTDEMKPSVWIIVDGIKDYFGVEQPEHWVFTIGDTLEKDFVTLICDSKTKSVIGYIPTK